MQDGAASPDPRDAPHVQVQAQAQVGRPDNGELSVMDDGLGDGGQHSVLKLVAASDLEAAQSQDNSPGGKKRARHALGLAEQLVRLTPRIAALTPRLAAVHGRSPSRSPSKSPSKSPGKSPGKVASAASSPSPGKGSERELAKSATAKGANLWSVVREQHAPHATAETAKASLWSVIRERGLALSKQEKASHDMRQRRLATEAKCLARIEQALVVRGVEPSLPPSPNLPPPRRSRSPIVARHKRALRRKDTDPELGLTAQAADEVDERGLLARLCASFSCGGCVLGIIEMVDTYTHLVVALVLPASIALSYLTYYLYQLQPPSAGGPAPPPPPAHPDWLLAAEVRRRDRRRHPTAVLPAEAVVVVVVAVMAPPMHPNDRP